MDKELIAELYDSIILEHSRHPRNKKILTCGCHKDGKNSSCGDYVTVYTNIDNNIIKDISFNGDGCAICISSSSLMTQIMKNKSVVEAKEIINNFIPFILEEKKDLPEDYEPLHIYETIHNFPSRVKCVLLPWRTLEYLLNHNCNNENEISNSISTEEFNGQ